MAVIFWFGIGLAAAFGIYGIGWLAGNAGVGGSKTGDRLLLAAGVTIVLVLVFMAGAELADPHNPVTVS